MIGKTHFLENEIIFACCDKNLIGKKLKYNNVIIEIKSNFYGVNVVSFDDILEAIEFADSINIFGKKICSFLLDRKIISKENIIYIGDVPHIQIYKI